MKKAIDCITAVLLGFAACIVCPIVVFLLVMGVI